MVARLRKRHHRHRGRNRTRLQRRLRQAARRARLRLWEEMLNILKDEMNNATYRRRIKRKQRKEKRLGTSEDRRLAAEEFQKVLDEERAGELGANADTAADPHDSEAPKSHKRTGNPRSRRARRK